MTIRKMLAWLIVVLLLAVSSAFIYRYITREVPNEQHVGMEFYSRAKPVFYKGELFDVSAFGANEGLKLPFKFLKEHIDPAIVYEPSSQSVIVTTKDKVVRLRTEGLTSMINDKPFSLQFMVETKDDVVYVPIDPLLDLYDLKIDEQAESGIVTVLIGGEPLQWGKIDAQDEETTIPMRTGPSIHDPILSDLHVGSEVRIWGESSKWYRIQTDTGLAGYVPAELVTLVRTETVPHTKKPETAYVPWKPTGGKINLTWEHVITKNPDTAAIGPTPGLNVISPTWFHLADDNGKLSNTADSAYVSWAQKRNLQVWALFDNGFEPDRTKQALSTHDIRMDIIRQLLSFAQIYKLQGINIDFENVYVEERQNLVQFVREFTPLAHEQGLVVSIDVTPKSKNEQWSTFLDRRALAETVDYMILMAYDEHWASSPVAGSVASLPWVDAVITRLLDEDDVPPSKLILGMPTYTREWTEEQVDGKTKVSSRAIFMERAQRTIREQKLVPVLEPKSGQNYVEYKEGKSVKKIWLEDAASIQARVGIAKRYDLAGVATWRRGFETPDIWGVIEKELNRRP